MTEKTPPRRRHSGFGASATRETPRRLPRTIVRTLRLLILRARLAIAVRGIGTVVALAIGSLLVVMAIDACVVVFASPVRYALTLLALSATVVGMLLLLIRPLARSLTLDGIARAIELHHPELQERISSSVELLSSKDAPELRGSDALIAALVNEAQDDVRTIRPGREITLRRARPPLLLAVLLAALLTELLLLWPVKTSRLLLRAVGPHLNLPNISAEDLTISPGDTVITRGQILRIDVEVADKSVRRADLRIPAPDGTETAERMARLFDPDSKRGRFTFTCPPAERTFSYRVHAGGAVSCYYTVTVVPFPAVTGIDLRYDYPEYTQLQPRIEADATGDIAALAGTTVTVTARTNTRVGSAEMLVDGEPLSGVQTELVATGDGTTDCVFRFKMAAGLSGRWEAEFADVHGFANTPVQHDLEALPDAAPTVAVWQPEEKRLRMSPDDKLPLGYAIGDDYGVSGAEVVMETDRGTIPSIPVPLSAQEEGRQETTGGPQRAVAGTVLLDLSALDLKGVSRLTFRLRATDSLPEDMQGPQEAFSDPYTIEFDVEAPSYAEQLLLTWEEDIRKALQEILDELAAAKKESTDVLPEVARPGDLDQAAQERIDRMHEHLDAADGSARELAQRVAWSMYGFLAPKLRATADNHISRADNLAGQVQLTEEPQQRGKLADEADLQIDLAVAAVSEMVEQFDAVAEAARRQQELQELAEQQTDLADTKYAMEEGPPDGQTAELAMSPDAWAELQREVATDVDAVLGEAMREASEELRARDLAAEARRLQEEQERLRDATKRLRTAQALDSAIAELAREQEELAEEAAADDLSAPQTGRMRDAAEKIRNYDLEPAIARQGEAAGALEARARSLRAELLAEEIARKAEQIAQQQKQLAEGAEQARQDPGTPYPGGLGERQQKLTEQMQQLTKEAAKATRYTQEALKKHSPAGQMQQATQAVQKAQTDRGALAAAVEAEAGARDAAAKAAQEKARAEDAAAKAKQDKADATLATAKARVAAENAERTAAEAKEAAADAEQAQARARDAQARAREAEASAKEAEARSDERQAQATDALAKAQEAQTTAKAAEAKAQQALAGAGEAADEAANTTTRAAEGAQKLAEELRKAAERSSTLADKPQRAQGIEQLARRQRDLQRRTSSVARRRPEAMRELQDGHLARMQREQAELALEAAQVAQRTQDVAPQQDRIELQASRAAGQAARRLQAVQLPEATQRAAEAGEKLGELADRLQEAARAAPPLPETRREAQLAEDTARLAQRQQRLARELEIFAEPEYQDLTVSRQDGLAERTADLREDTDRIRGALQALAPQDQALAETTKAVEQLDRAGQAQGTAQQAITEARTAEAIPAQQQSASALDAAARALDQLADRLDQVAGRDKDSDLGVAQAQLTQDLAAAAQATDDAARSRQAQDADRAARHLQAARQQAADRAAQLGMRPVAVRTGAADLSTYGLTLDPRGRRAPDMRNAPPPELAEFGIMLDDWAKLPGQLRDEILQAAGDDSPKEYRSLIKRYFRSVARHERMKRAGGEE